MDTAAGMAILALALCVGWGIGKWAKPGPKAARAMGQGQKICVWVIILAMGIRLGADERVFEAIGTLGAQALAVTIGAMAASILLAYALGRAMGRRKT